MVNRRRYRRKKTTSLQELGFLGAICFILVILSSWQYIRNDVVGVVVFLFSVSLLVGAILYTFLVWRQNNQRKALRALEMSHIDVMSGEEFEDYVAELLKFQGYKVRKTPRTSDYGVDIVASKSGLRTAVQVKRSNNKIGSGAVQEVVMGKIVRQYGCSHIIIVTNNSFTRDAVFLAGQAECELIDRAKLADWILDFQRVNMAKRG